MDLNAFDLPIISSVDLKQCPQSSILSLTNSQKLHGAKSGVYGGC